MRLTDVVANIGKRADLRTAEFTVRVLVVDAKVQYGSVRYVVTPVSGEGQATVDAVRLRIDTEGV